MLLRDERADADAERAELYVASPARNACHVDAAAGERTLWPELALSHTPQIGGFLRGLEGGGDTAFPASDTLRLGSRESLESLIGDATSTSDYKEDMRPPSGTEGQGTEPSLALDLLPMSAPRGGAGAEEEMRLPEELLAHFYCPPSDATPEHSAYFVGLPPFVPKVKADLSTNLASSMAEGVVSDTLANVFLGKVAERDSWYQCGVDGTCERQEASSLPPAGLCSTSSVYTAFAGLLPQKTCYICGDEASGYHYGVLTCGSCKVFFKRAVEGHQKYLCAGRNDCIVDKIRRKNCPACRLRKCYQAGMMLGGRRLKKFGALKPMALTLTAPPGLTLSRASLDMASMARVPTIRELNASPQIISILENIEPEVVLSEHDSSLPDLPHHLLSSLNRLCEKQLLWIVKWSKLLPGFRSLHINDQMCLIQHSWMNLMLFSLGWMSFKNTTRGHLYFAPDLVMNEVRMKQSPIAHLCTAIQLIPHEFDKLQLTREEFLCMKVLTLLTVVPLEGLKSQRQFEEMRQNYIRELSKAIQLKTHGAAGALQRSSRLGRLMETMHEIVKKVNLYCLSVFVQADVMQVEFPEMMSEVITSQLPRLLAGMVKPLPLVFEKK